MNAYEFLKKLLEETPSPKNMYIQLMHTGNRYKLIRFDTEQNRVVVLDSHGVHKGLSKSSNLKIISVVTEKVRLVGTTVIARVRSGT